MITTLQARIGTWQTATFGENQTVTGIDAHLSRELKELLDAPTEENEREESADLVVLLMGRATLRGFNLLDEVEKKFAVLQTRTWGEPDHEGVISHVRF